MKKRVVAGRRGTSARTRAANQKGRNAALICRRGGVRTSQEAAHKQKKCGKKEKENSLSFECRRNRSDAAILTKTGFNLVHRHKLNKMMIKPGNALKNPVTLGKTMAKPSKPIKLLHNTVHNSLKPGKTR